ncbi:Smr/MutS family protein [Enhygromyxa salina]|uniref:Smr/MutS family protein n=1 Tax=Enhygromyxa salina TaxID=215803 RepID=UPI0004E709AA|nr:Smr/MutS family protein [Enhygromyxa salina]
MAADERDADPRVKFGALLEPLLDQLAPAEPPPPEPEPEPEPERRRLDEGELMALIFSLLDHDNPRVCEGIEFDRLVVLSERELPQAPVDQPAQIRPPPRGDEVPAPPPQPSLEFDPSEAWIGRSWADDIATVPSALLDRPQLDPKQHDLIERASKRERATLNLRRLDREAALRHLQLFIHACRSERIRLCTVVTGKGVHSSGEPVLKRVVLEWCRGPGRIAVLGWAPQLDQHGEWGSLALELRAMPTR